MEANKSNQLLEARYRWKQDLHGQNSFNGEHFTKLVTNEVCPLVNGSAFQS
jgi:hypothetical protein